MRWGVRDPLLKEPASYNAKKNLKYNLLNLCSLKLFVRNVGINCVIITFLCNELHEAMKYIFTLQRVELFFNTGY